MPTVMPDVANQTQAQTEGTLDWVGMSNIEVPLMVAAAGASDGVSESPTPSHRTTSVRSRALLRGMVARRADDFCAQTSAPTTCVEGGAQTTYARRSRRRLLLQVAEVVPTGALHSFDILTREERSLLLRAYMRALACLCL